MDIFFTVSVVSWTGCRGTREESMSFKIFVFDVWLQSKEIPCITPYPAVPIRHKSFTPFNPQQLETEHLISHGEALGGSRICEAQVEISLVVMKGISAFANHLADSLQFVLHFIFPHTLSLLKSPFSISQFSVSFTLMETKYGLNIMNDCFSLTIQPLLYSCQTPTLSLCLSLFLHLHPRGTLTHFSTLLDFCLRRSSSRSRNSPSIRSHAGSTYNPTPPHSWLISWNGLSSQTARNHPLPQTASSCLYLTPFGTDQPNWHWMVKRQHRRLMKKRCWLCGVALKYLETSFIPAQFV